MGIGIRGLAGLFVVALAVTSLASCTNGGDDGAEPPPTDAAAVPEPWCVEEGDASYTIVTPTARVVVGQSDGALSVSRSDHESFFTQSLGLYIVRDLQPVGVGDARLGGEGDDEVSFDVTFEDGSAGHLALRDAGHETLAVALSLDDTTGVTAWGDRISLADDEAIYGLTERIVDDQTASEFIPEEVGSLDRRGELVSMEVTPTISGYAPFHQSSAGYGLLVDGFMPGSYDVGSSDPATLTYQFEWDPAEDSAGFHLFTGPGHTEVVDAYHELTGRPPLPPDFVFTHWRGRDELPVGEPVAVPTPDGGVLEINASVAGDLDAYEAYGIPAGIYHIDRPWAVGEVGYGELSFDPARFPNTTEMLALLEDHGWHNMVWVSPWAVGARGEVARAEGFLAPNSSIALDLTNPDAVDWLRRDVLAFLDSDDGRHVDGFFMDRGDEGDVTSTEADIYADGRNGRQIHNWYPVAYERIFRDVIDEARPDDGFLLARPGYTGSQASVMRWGGDTHSRDGLAIPETPVDDAPSTDLGLRSVLISLQRAAFMGTPYWGSDIGGYNGWIDREVYARWIQVGFASPLMRFHGQGGTPWEPTLGGGVDEGLLEIYVDYVGLRHDMNDYLVATAAQASDAGLPMARPLVFAWPDEPGALDRWDEWMLGDDLLVAPVWESGARKREVWIPPGTWVDFWDRDVQVEGPTLLTADAPLDRLPMWVRDGSPLLALDGP